MLLLPIALLAFSGAAKYKCDGHTTAADVVAAMGQSMTGKHVLITGGDSGLGLSTAIALASVNASLYIASLSPDTHGKAAAAAIVNQTGNSKVFVLPLDLSSFASVRACAESYKNLSSSLDVLINDAGIGFNPPSLPPMTDDGYERVFRAPWPTLGSPRGWESPLSVGGLWSPPAYFCSPMSVAPLDRGGLSRPLPTHRAV